MLKFILASIIAGGMLFLITYRPERKTVEVELPPSQKQVCDNPLDKILGEKEQEHSGDRLEFSLLEEGLKGGGN